MNDFVANESFQAHTTESMYVKTSMKSSLSEHDTSDVSIIVHDTSNSKINYNYNFENIYF